MWYERFQGNCNITVGARKKRWLHHIDYGPSVCRCVWNCGYTVFVRCFWEVGGEKELGNLLQGMNWWYPKFCEQLKCCRGISIFLQCLEWNVNSLLSCMSGWHVECKVFIDLHHMIWSLSSLFRFHWLAQSGRISKDSDLFWCCATLTSIFVCSR